MKAFFSAVALVFASLFGIHYAQPMVVAPLATTQPPSVHALPAPSLPVTAIALPLVNEGRLALVPAIGKAPAIFEPDLVLGTATPTSGTVTHAELTAALEQIANSLRSQLFSFASTPSFSGLAATTPVSFQAFSISQRIDQLTNVTISNATVSGLSGLTDADIPDGITASNYLPLSGGTITGALSVASLNASSTSYDSFVAANSMATNATSTNLAVTGTASTSALVVSNSFTFGNFTGNRTSLSFMPALTNSSGGNTANTIYVSVLPSSGTVTGSYTGIRSTVAYNSANYTSGAVTGVYGLGELFGNGHANQTQGVYGVAQYDGADTLDATPSSLYGGRFQALVTGSGKMTHVIGVKIDGPSVVGTATAAFGLYLQDMTNQGAGTISDSAALESVSKVILSGPGGGQGS